MRKKKFSYIVTEEENIKKKKGKGRRYNEWKRRNRKGSIEPH